MELPEPIVVTGATGYLGKELCRCLLDSGHHVIAVVRNANKISGELLPALCSGQLKLISTLEINWQSELANSRWQVMFHVAGWSGIACDRSIQEQAINSNVVFGTQLLDAAGKFPGRLIIWAGSYWQYSHGGDIAIPNSFYAATKSAFDQIAMHYLDNCGVRGASLVLCDVYGQNDSRGKLLNYLAAAVEGSTKDKRLALELTDGKQLVSFVNVGDVVSAFFGSVTAVCEASSPGLRRYLVRGPEATTLRETITSLMSSLDLPYTPELKWGAKGKSPVTVQNLPSLPAVPGWRPSISNVNGFKELLTEARNRGRRTL